MYLFAVKILFDLFSLIGKWHRKLCLPVMVSMIGSYATYLLCHAGDHKRYDVNVRSIVAFREIGRGFTHVECVLHLHLPTIKWFKIRQLVT